MSNGARRSAAPSARSLLLTVLGEFVLPTGGQVWTSVALEAMAGLGVGAASTRQALARSADAGLLTPVRIGRQTRWDLTERATGLLGDGTRRIYSFGRAVAAWDGRWLLVLATVPEGSRHLRHQLRVRLGWAGFAPLSPGTWISPWANREAEVIELLAAVGLTSGSTIFVSRLTTTDDPAALAARTWDLLRVEADYRAFVAGVAARPPGADAEAFVATTMLVHEWRHFPAADPDLPAELLPPSWTGREATKLFHDRHAAWAPTARAWWASLG